MLDTKKEQERDELHRAIWAIADELCGAVDGWDFKNYVLGTMIRLGTVARPKSIKSMTLRVDLVLCF